VSTNGSRKSRAPAGARELPYVLHEVNEGRRDRPHKQSDAKHLERRSRVRELGPAIGEAGHHHEDDNARHEQQFDPQREGVCIRNEHDDGSQGNSPYGQASQLADAAHAESADDRRADEPLDRRRDHRSAPVSRLGEAYRYRGSEQRGRGEQGGDERSSRDLDGTHKDHT
jgi:hypothetical protein